jgi:hypothetical protein
MLPREASALEAILMLALPLALAQSVVVTFAMLARVWWRFVAVHSEAFVASASANLLRSQVGGNAALGHTAR